MLATAVDDGEVNATDTNLYKSIDLDGFAVIKMLT